VLTSNFKGRNTNPLKGIQIYHYPALNVAEQLGVPYPVVSFHAYKLFRNIIKNCDLVHAHGHVYLSSWLAGVVAKQYKKPFIVTQHNTYIDYKSVLNMFENLNDFTVGKSVLKKADRIITVSKETKKYVLRLGADKTKTSVMYNGVDINTFKPANKTENRKQLGLPVNRKIVFSVRRLVYKNGLDTLIESVPLVAKKYPDVLFVVAGKGPNRKLIEDRIQELQIQNNITLAGFVPDELLPTYYGAADMFVLPSASGEGLPLVLLEAMSCGLPVIATTVGGTPEIVQHNKTGILIPPIDPQAIADSIVRLLVDETLCEIVGKHARATVEEQFSWEANVRKLEEIYREFIQ
jgi:glycosyltransferase involved in cell wall biosynthesis